MLISAQKKEISSFINTQSMEVVDTIALIEEENWHRAKWKQLIAENKIPDFENIDLHSTTSSFEQV